tara:strand:+ start:4572 stop:4781 length:210 start_codon:yes stop_codon:yes gene_type:complete
MAITYDFQIVASNIPGVAQVVPQNEDAFCYLVDETDYTIFSDGSTALFTDRVGDFISDAGHAHMCCNIA